MKLKDTACDVEYSKKLKKLGLRISSLLFYNVITDEVVLNDDCNNYINVRNYAYTVAELGEMIDGYSCGRELVILKDDYSNGCDTAYIATYMNGSNDYIPNLKLSETRDVKLANCLAKLLIWLIENKHANVEDLNNE